MEKFNFSLSTAGRHLKRIECLPKGVSPYTLLLSNNEISVVENLQYFGHLQQVRNPKILNMLVVLFFAGSY